MNWIDDLNRAMGYIEENLTPSDARRGDADGPSHLPTIRGLSLHAIRGIERKVRLTFASDGKSVTFRTRSSFI